MRKQPLRLAIRDAAWILEEAGVASPRADAELLAAHVLGVDRGSLPLVPLIDPADVDALGQLVAERAKRIPLQHITGWAALGGITVAVGPGVFVPRPETELLLEWGLERLAPVANPVVVDLCTGSGVLALAVGEARADAQIYAVDNDPRALAWARRNVDARRSGAAGVRLVSGEVADPRLLVELDGLVDLVLCNPPYVRRGQAVPPEVAGHDPERAVFACDGGLEVIKHAVAAAARLLRSGGGVAIEHGDDQASSVASLLAARTVLSEVQQRADLAKKPRFAVARRTG